MNRKVVASFDSREVKSAEVINIKTKKELKPIMNSEKLSVLNIPPGEIEKMEHDLLTKSPEQNFSDPD